MPNLRGGSELALGAGAAAWPVGSAALAALPEGSSGAGRRRRTWGVPDSDILAKGGANVPRLRPWGESSDDDDRSVIAEGMAPDPEAEGRLYELASKPLHARQGEPAVGVVTLVVDTEGMRGKAHGLARTAGPVRGRVLSVQLRYHPEAPTSTDVRLRAVPKEGGPPVELLVVPESHTDGYFAPDAEPLWRPMPGTYSYVPFVVDGQLELVVTESHPLRNAVTARVVIEELPASGP